MLTKNVIGSVSPMRVEVFPTHECYLRKNIQEELNEEGVTYSYDEVFFVDDVTVEQLNENFETYWIKGVTYGVDITVDDRLSVLEALMEELIDGKN